MPKRYKRLIYAFITTILILVFGVRFNNGNKAHAEAVGVVNVSGYLNVRQGPGISYALLKSGGTGVTLTNGQKVSITAKAGDWYHISFKLNGNNHKGYVKGSYIKVQGRNVCTEVTASIVDTDLMLMKKASATGACVKAGEEDIIMPTGSEVTLIDETTKKKQKWYYISFDYQDETYEGYVKAESLNISYGNGIPGIWKGSAKTPLYKDAGKSTVVESAGKKVNIGVNKQFNIINESTVAKNKYFYIKVRAKNKTVYGYVPAISTRFQIVQTEQASPAEVTENPSVTETPADETNQPDATVAPDATATPEVTPTPSKSPSDTPEPTSAVPLTSDEFKKELQDEGFPESYIKPLMLLHEKYPRWKFKVFDTGLNWATVIKNESVVGVNLLSVNKSYDWKSTEEGAYDWKTDKYIPHDGSTWVAASEKAVKYYMDPRNFLDERGIFQFESLEYHSDTQTQDGVEKILSNTPMHDKTFSYNGGKSEIKYSEAFIKAAESSGVSPYHLASRVKQEVVVSSTLMSTSVSGTVSGYEGIYNFYNIGAYSSTEAGGAIANGLKWASTGDTYNRPWNDRYKSITGGAEYIGKNYINVGQNTLYLEKFNVTSTNRYDHQYMTNIEAPNSEATKTVSAYGVIDKDMSIIFSIPVYNNMPDKPCEVPSGGQNPNNYLKTLSVKNHKFNSPFVLGDDGSKTYKVSVDKDVDSIKISATTVSSSATLSGTGNKELSEGVNTFTINVTSESGDVRKYTIEVTRE